VLSLQIDPIAIVNIGSQDMGEYVLCYNQVGVFRTAAGTPARQFDINFTSKPLGVGMCVALSS
jgi:hypothetical protein